MSDRDSVVTVDELDDADFDTGEPPVQPAAGRREGGDREERPGSLLRRPGEPYFGELCTKLLFIQSKKFFIDVKDTRRGRIYKLSEVQMNGTKNRMTMELKVVKELHEKLSDFIEQYTKLGPRSKNPSQATIMSESIITPTRRYYLDLRENTRGRFLKIAMLMGPPAHERCEIVIPAQGMVDLRDTLTDLFNMFVDDGPEVDETGRAIVAPSRRESERVESPQRDGKELSLEAPGGKTFYAAVIKRKQETFLRISEVRRNFKTAVNVPREMWDRFLYVLKKNAGELCQTADELNVDTTMATVVEHDDDDTDDVIWTGTSQAEVF